MKKQIIFSVFLFTITAIFSFGQGVWIEEQWTEYEVGIEGYPNIPVRTGKLAVNGRVYEIKNGSNLSGADLSGADLSNASLSANLSGSDLSYANLSGAMLNGADLRNSNLTLANCIGTIFWAARMKGANITFANFQGAEIDRVDGLDDLGGSANIGNVIRNITKGNYNDIQKLKPQIEALGKNDESIGKQLTTLGQNDLSIGEQMDVLGAQLAQNDLEIGREIDALGQGAIVRGNQINSLRQKDKSIMSEINTIKAQLQTLVAQVAERDAQIAEKDAKIAELEQGGGGQSLEQVLEKVRDARAGSVVLTVDPDGDNITLGLTIEQSDNLIEWTKLDGEMTRTIPIPDGKKFYRFALDK